MHYVVRLLICCCFVGSRVLKDAPATARIETSSPALLTSRSELCNYELNVRCSNYPALNSTHQFEAPKDPALNSTSKLQIRNSKDPALYSTLQF